MRKLLFLIVAISLSTAALAFAGGVSLTAVNQELANAFRQHASSGSQTSFAFSQLEANDEHVLTAKGRGSYERRGRMNLRLELSDLTYAYGDGSAPSTRLAGTLHANLVELLGEQVAPVFLQSLTGTLQPLVRDLVARKYGNAMSFTVKTLSPGRKEAGKYTGQRTQVSFAIDMSKLPAGMAAESIFAKDGTLIFEVKSAEELTLEARLTTNPVYKDLRKGGRGFREHLVELLGREEKVTGELVGYVRSMEKMVAPFLDTPEAGFQPSR